MNRILSVLLILVALGLGATSVMFFLRAQKAEKELEEIRNATFSVSKCDTPQKTGTVDGDSPQKNGDSPQAAAQTGAKTGGDSPQKKDKNANSVTNLPFEVASIKYEDKDLRISFANAGKGNVIAPQDNALSISPALKTTFHVSGDKVVVHGDFAPDTFYTAILSPDWKTVDGRTLGRVSRLSVRTPKPQPQFNMLSSGLYYPVKAFGALRFPYESRFATNLTITISKAYENNLNSYSIESWAAQSRMTKVCEGKVHLEPPYDTTVNRMLELDSIFTNRTPGVYRLEITSDAYRRYWWGDGGYAIDQNRIFALTDLGINAAISEGDGRRVFVSVCRFSDGKPVGGASVTVLSHKNRIVASGVTRADGCMCVDFDPSYDNKDDTVHGVLVKTADDTAFMNLDGDSRRDRCNSDGAFSEVRAFVFAERDVCRPGESFDSGVFVRSSAKSGSEALSGATLDLELSDCEGTKVASRRVTADKYGFASMKWDIPKNAAMGMWSVACKLGDKEIGTMKMRVAFFVADRFRVSLETDKTAWTGLDRAVSFKGDATYYFGDKVDGADWKFSCSTFHAPEPKHWKGWTVGAPSDIEGVTFKASGTVSGGAFAVQYPGVVAQGVKQAFAPVGIAAEASVVEAGGRAVTATRLLTAFPTDRFIGLRDAEKKGAEARAFEFALMPATTEDVVVNETDTEIAISFEKVEWDYSYVRDGDNYRTVWRSSNVPQPKMTRKVKLPIGAAAATWRGRIAFNASEMPSGRYIMTATLGTRLKTVHDFWHWSGEVGERSTSPAALDISSNAEKYRPGETAELSFTVPYSGRAFVVAGAGGIEYTHATDVKSGKNTVAVPVPAGCVAGRYYASITLVTENAPAMRRLAGIARMEIDNSEQRLLKVGCELPEKASPSSEIDVTVTLADKSGAPRAGRVRLAATDVGVLALTGFATPDPYAYFFAKDYDLPFATYDAYSQIYPDLKILPNGQIGGGADMSMASFNRRDSKSKQKETARVVLPPIDVPASGRATVKVRLPDHTGAMRFMAVAADEKSAGSADAELVMRNPITAMLSAPLFAAGGDKFTLTVQLFNHDMRDEQWKLGVKLPEYLSVDGSHEIRRQGRLLKGCNEVVSVVVDVDEDAAGAGRIVAEFELGGEKVTDEAFVTARPVRPAETRVEYLVVTNGMPSLPAVENDWIKAERKIEKATSPAFAIRDSLAWLGKYPYGCLEQTAAMAFPFLVAPDLKSLGFLSEAEFAMARQRIEAAYGNLMQMSCGDGFAMWPGGSDIWTAGSLFACHFMLEAEKAGLLKIDGERRGRFLGWFADIADVASDNTREDRAYAAYVLAVAGDERFLNPARNVSRADCPDWATFLAASALVRGGYASEGLDALNAAIAAHAWDGASDAVRRMGMTLFIVSRSGLAEDTQSLMPIVGRLNSRLRGDGSAWGTTQDNAWATAGLAAFLNGAELPKGVQFVRVVTTGIPKKPFPRPNPVKLTRRYLDAGGKEVSRIKKGELVTVELTLRSPGHIENAVLADILPAGLELEDDTFKTRSQKVPGAEKAPDGFIRLSGRSELRDDRYLWFGSVDGLKDDRRHLLEYRVRAVTPGTYHVPSATVEDMYNPDLRGGIEGNGVFTVE